MFENYLNFSGYFFNKGYQLLKIYFIYCIFLNIKS